MRLSNGFILRRIRRALFQPESDASTGSELTTQQMYGFINVFCEPTTYLLIQKETSFGVKDTWFRKLSTFSIPIPPSLMGTKGTRWYSCLSDIVGLTVLQTFVCVWYICGGASRRCCSRITWCFQHGSRERRKGEQWYVVELCVIIAVREQVLIALLKL